MSYPEAVVFGNTFKILSEAETVNSSELAGVIFDMTTYCNFPNYEMEASCALIKLGLAKIDQNKLDFAGKPTVVYKNEDGYDEIDKS